MQRMEIVLRLAPLIAADIKSCLSITFIDCIWKELTTSSLRQLVKNFMMLRTWLKKDTLKSVVDKEFSKHAFFCADIDECFSEYMRDQNTQNIKLRILII